MKSLLKLGSLFALIIAGRYMHLTEAASEAGLAKSPLLFTPSTATTMTLTRYTQEPVTTITPVSQREEAPVTWF
ncbi:hypothetical protein QMK33_07320 [Hymenobacter sp. H14-R3]|uniref:hypothetical protein n=1 Tax=Hymenobacter sp. H14-R3 TaxID=3046308 RepID=UPI0024B98963|nr:hypothetical protein [Hymenobacter sp. H14-R3]MDJ0364958.1 hypothetical protein [Hymenobacter sp. H14-R3]